MAKRKIIVVGGGAMGMATALALLRRGCQVRVIERLAPGHDQGSSHGDGRLIRHSYPEPGYAELIHRAYAAWRALETRTGVKLIETTGGLDLGPEDGTVLKQIATVLEDQGVAFEALEPDAVHQRFPQVAMPTGSAAIYHAEGAVIRADLALAALWRQAAAAGASFVTGTGVARIDLETDRVVVRTEAGRRYTAQGLVLAAGAWNGPLAAQLDLSLPLTVTREQLAYFPPRTPTAAEADRTDSIPGHGLDAMPTVMDYHVDPNFYAMPIVAVRGVKCGWHRTGPPVDPDAPRAFEPSLRDSVREWVAERLPHLDTMPVLESTCLYTNTPDHDFILDRHPAWPQVVIAAGFSGHGFKFSPVIGELAADLATGAQPTTDLGLFRLDRFD